MTIAEVAHSLSGVNSFNGHLGQYSTAQHSCLVSDMLGGSYCGLMHDGHEAICGDVSTPVKNALNLLGNGVWREFENAIAKRFCHYWGVTFPFPEAVHKADHLSRRIEVASLASNEMKASLRKLGLEPLYDIEWMIQEVWTPDRAFSEFMDRFNKLGPTGRVR